MSWKDWPYWLKGGIIFLVLDLFIIILMITTSSPVEADLFAVGISQMPFSLLPILFNSENSLSLIIFFGLAGWFALGSLIGFILGKIKSKKEAK